MFRPIRGNTRVAKTGCRARSERTSLSETRYPPVGATPRRPRTLQNLIHVGEYGNGFERPLRNLFRMLSIIKMSHSSFLASIPYFSLKCQGVRHRGKRASIGRSMEVFTPRHFFCSYADHTDSFQVLCLIHNIDGAHETRFSGALCP